MDTPAGHNFVMENSLKRYGVERWGEEFLGVNDQGHLVFRAPDLPPVDLQALSEHLESKHIHPPFLVRFPSMIETRMARLRRAFENAAKENGFPGDFVGVVPLKVNQRRAVVDALLHGAAIHRCGIEAGTKPELLLAMILPPTTGAPLLINGFKDRNFMRMAFHAAELGHHVIVILESIREVVRFIDVSREQPWKAMPELGVRAKLYTRGSGRWQGSGGETSKFGLTTSEILGVVEHLEQHGMVDKLALLHFHIGSQITRIKRIKQAVREGTRLYAALRLGRAPSLRYLDLGGGLGVDYDGSRTSYPSSANYTVEEYASQAVFEVVEVLAQTGAAAPCLITESGRAMVANHAVTIADLREVQGERHMLAEQRDDEHRLIKQLRETCDAITAKNYEEYFHDAIDFRDEALELFSAGYLTLEDRANAEILFNMVREKTARIIATLKRPSEEILDHLAIAQRKYLANFSVFQSIPDSWSIDQVFPAAPLSRHGERPSINTEIVDITCDSDGAVKCFAHPEDNLRFLPLHERRDKNERYYLGFFMTGAYQDSLANDHNLLMRPHEVIVRPQSSPPPVGTGMQRLTFADVALDIRTGETNEDALLAMDFDSETLRGLIRERHAELDTTLGSEWTYGLLHGYPYLIRE